MKTPNKRSTRHKEFLVEWAPYTCPYHIALQHQSSGTPISHLSISALFDILRPLEPLELDPPCYICGQGGGDSADPHLVQCERCLRWIHTHCLPPPEPPIAELILAEGWTCPQCAPPSTSSPCPHQICTITFTPSIHSIKTIRTRAGGRKAIAAFKTKVDHTPQTHNDSTQMEPNTTPQLENLNVVCCQ